VYSLELAAALVAAGSAYPHCVSRPIPVFASPPLQLERRPEAVVEG